MDKLTMKSTYLGLLVPLLFCGKIVIGLQHEVDGVVSVGGNNCDGPISIPYKIFNHTTLYVCTHGLVSFGSAVTSTSGAIPQRTGPPVIAVNWRYFNTHGTNRRVFYRSTSSDSSLLSTTSHVVQQALSHQGFHAFQSRWVFVVTWNNVTHNSLDSSSTFQLVLTSDAWRHAMIFHYRTIHHIGTVGYDGRDGRNYYRLGSNELPTGTNAGFPGRWVFRANEVPVRLVGSESRPREGRVEVFYNGTWGTVCDRSFTDISAKVVCHQLNFGYLGYVLHNVHDAGTGPIWLDNVQCRGTESDIGECPHNPWGHTDCDHLDDVSIACYVHTTTTTATFTDAWWIIAVVTVVVSVVVAVAWKCCRL